MLIVGREWICLHLARGWARYFFFVQRTVFFLVSYEMKKKAFVSLLNSLLNSQRKNEDKKAIKSTIY
jgi:hypothetical protein